MDARQLVADQVSALAESKLKSTLDVSFANVNLAEAKLLLVAGAERFESVGGRPGDGDGAAERAGFVLERGGDAGAVAGPVDDLMRDAIAEPSGVEEICGCRRARPSDSRKAEHALYYPSVGVIGTAGFVPAGYETVPGSYGAIGMNVTIPIFNGGLFKARQTEAELRAKAVSAECQRSGEPGGARRSRGVSECDYGVRPDGADEAVAGAGATGAGPGADALRPGAGQHRGIEQAQLNVTSAQIADTSARYDYQTQRILVDYQTGVLH